MIRLALCLIFVLSVFLNSSLSLAQKITYMGFGERRDYYHTELLMEVFKQFPEKQYSVTRYADTETLPHHRSFSYLAENKDINIVVAYASEERDEKFLGVHIPILKGLNGWRTSIIHNDNIDLFKEVTTLEQFKQYVPGQFHTWTDYKILVKNGITPARGANYDGLFYMLDKKRFDYFPRSILEIDNEFVAYKKPGNLNIALEPHILIKYPTAVYFYVNKESVELAHDINEGLENLIASGKFDQIFNQYFGGAIDRIRNENRHVFSLKNPLLPKSVPVERDELWLSY